MKSADSLLQIQPKKILLIKPSAIGDVVHGLPVLNLMRRRWPSAHIAWMLTPLCAGLLEGHPQLDEIILFHRRLFGRGWYDPLAAVGLLKFTSGLHRRKFGLVVDLQGLFRTGYFAAATHAPVRVGFAEAREGAGIFYTHRISSPGGERHPQRSGGRHAVDRNLDLAEALGCGRSPVEFSLPIGEQEKKWVAENTGSLGPYAVLIPGTIWETKRWPVERFAALADILREQHGLKIIAAGSRDEMSLAEQIHPDLNLAGQTTLRQLTALIAQANLVVANDSGPMHIAAALHRPLITPFGPTNPDLTGPYKRSDTVVRLDIPCSPCYSRKCSHTSCLRLLETEVVAEMVNRQLVR
jgi:heptosyltransferase-1